MQSSDVRFTGLTTAAGALGMLLILPPLLNLINQGGTIVGVPAAMVYVFGGWLALIVLIAVLTLVHN